MEIRKTILYIGNSETDRKLFDQAIAQDGKRCNFLALDYEPYSIERLKKSQPFWYQSIFLDLGNPSTEGFEFLREITGIGHLKHVPVVAYTNRCTFSDINNLKQAGALHYLLKTTDTSCLIRFIHELNSQELIPIVYKQPIIHSLFDKAQIQLSGA